MFYGDVTTKISAPQPIDRSAGGRESLDRAAELLAKAENPVIISGDDILHLNVIIIKQKSIIYL